ncbi:hypothetical protein Q8A73_022659 [Channa argus]|nr:hypothetical protein Q8A73_022659 [Channa argus]
MRSRSFLFALDARLTGWSATDVYIRQYQKAEYRGCCGQVCGGVRAPPPAVKFRRVKTPLSAAFIKGTHLEYSKKWQTFPGSLFSSDVDCNDGADFSSQGGCLLFNNHYPSASPLYDVSRSLQMGKQDPQVQEANSSDTVHMTGNIKLNVADKAAEISAIKLFTGRKEPAASGPGQLENQGLHMPAAAP